MQEERQEDVPIEEGTRFEDRYVIEGVIGEGGFATVYSATDEVIERGVALKILSLEDLEGEELERALRRFLREARLAGRISHPGIVDIYDFGQLGDGGEPFIVMERLEGESLYDEIHGRGPLAPDWLLPKYSEVLEALGEAHREQIVHKDLKPGNIFLHRPGTHREVWKLVDFGVAHIDGAKDARLTQTGFLSGTPQYLPPEYIQHQKVSPQMDVYQMALSLIEAICGEPVVSVRKPIEAAMKHVNGELDIPEELLEGEIGAVLNKALAEDPEDRFPTGGEFGAALSKVDPDGVPEFEGVHEREVTQTARWAAVDLGNPDGSE